MFLFPQASYRFPNQAKEEDNAGGQRKEQQQDNEDGEELSQDVLSRMKRNSRSNLSSDQPG